jgi:hypothetical protein
LTMVVWKMRDRRAEKILVHVPSGPEENVWDQSFMSEIRTLLIGKVVRDTNG